jgi:hypothetical protein
MIKQFIHRYIRNLERRYAYDATYMHELADISTSAFNRFVVMQMSAGQWRGGAPMDALFASGIAGALVEDCGPCVQIASDMAVEAGVSPQTIRSLLSGTRSNSDAQLGFDYGLALLRGSDNLDELREAVISRWGEKALIALTLHVMAGRNYPVLKRAMGHAKTCQRVRVGKDEVVVDQSLKAA